LLPTHRNPRPVDNFIIVEALNGDVHESSIDPLILHIVNMVLELTLNPGLGRPPFSIKIELPKGEELQSTAEIACKVLSYFPGLCPNSLRF
jgi:hypothetical protein